ncbi:hypothetical protein [Pedobacter sp. Leaf176]|uniref:hypothetical protein n=1 Tax=Pedobacter sp. Leaf176 TaxID=1736286 RepID=UPI000B1F9F28|nr:hypothetical protein [Pedobacter sp. Leaf176]
MDNSPIHSNNLKAELRDYQAFNGNSKTRKALFSKLINSFLSSYKKVSGKDKLATR